MISENISNSNCCLIHSSLSYIQFCITTLHVARIIKLLPWSNSEWWHSRYLIKVSHMWFLSKLKVFPFSSLTCNSKNRLMIRWKIYFFSIRSFLAYFGMRLIKWLQQSFLTPLTCSAMKMIPYINWELKLERWTKKK